MADFVHVDPKIWQVIAGPCSEFHTANSMVYYFPQGHVDEASAPLPIDLSRLITQKPYILCKVNSVNLVANKATDEVMAFLSLTPTTSTDSFNPLPVPVPVPEDNNNNNDRIVSYVKILQPIEVPPFPRGIEISCSVPDDLADSILPPINTQSEHLQFHKVTFTDLMWKEWDFVHYYYRHAKFPQKHLIIDGWEKFATDKKLRTGDAIVFVKKDSWPGKIFVGIRRAHKLKAHPGTVASAIGSAMNRLPFKVLYTPSPGTGWTDFVVRSHIVDESMRVRWWALEMRVMMAVESSVFSDVAWIHGTLRAIHNTFNRNLPTSSPFRAFLIAWEQPERTLYQFVSPWQVRPITRVPSSSGTHY